MKKITEKIFNFIMIFIFILPLFTPIISNAITSNFQNYIAMGDSIAYGYGLVNRDSQSYPEIVRSKLNISKNNFKNLAISGITCKEYYELIQTSEYTSAIKSADLITVSIGSNELLELATAALAEVTGISANDPAFLTKAKAVFQEANYMKKAMMLKQIYNFFTSNETKIKIENSINSYSQYWSQSVQYIKSINPNATIIATEFYNPYYELQVLSYDLGGFVDEAIVKMNKILHNTSNNEQNYKIAKIYNDFNTTNPRITNVEIDVSKSIFNIDPHPNISGHQKIATRVMDAVSTVSVKKDISGLKISDIQDVTYTGSKIQPNITITDGSKKLVENVDYTVIYINNQDIGQAKVSITGIGNYSGSVIKTFNIKNAESKDISKMNITNIQDQTYTGIKITPDIVIKDGNNTLKYGTDYTLTYQDNINVGIAKVNIIGTGNYSGSIIKQFNIIPKDISEAYISEIAQKEYTGVEIEPDIVISDGSSKLILNKDYTLLYSNNVNVGEATITISGTNNYSGTINKSFEIINNQPDSTKKDISTIECSELEDKIYTGKLITPEVVLKDNDNILVKDTDYELSYTNNLTIGQGLLTIKGIGSYTGKIEKTFNIIKKDINFSLIDDISPQEYTGKAIFPKLTITSDYIELVKDKDYKVEYSNNIGVGTATITITGINNYSGTATKTFNIIKSDTPSKDNKEASANNTIINNKGNDTDKTISNIILPKTGISRIVLLIIAGLTVVAIITHFTIRKKYSI